MIHSKTRKNRVQSLVFACSFFCGITHLQSSTAATQNEDCILRESQAIQSDASLRVGEDFTALVELSLWICATTTPKLSQSYRVSAMEERLEKELEESFFSSARPTHTPLYTHLQKAISIRHHSSALLGKVLGSKLQRFWSIHHPLASLRKKILEIPPPVISSTHLHLGEGMHWNDGTIEMRLPPSTTRALEVYLHESVHALQKKEEAPQNLPLGLELSDWSFPDLFSQGVVEELLAQSFTELSLQCTKNQNMERHLEISTWENQLEAFWNTQGLELATALGKRLWPALTSKTGKGHDSSEDAESFRHRSKQFAWQEHVHYQLETQNPKEALRAHAPNRAQLLDELEKLCTKAK